MSPRSSSERTDPAPGLRDPQGRPVIVLTGPARGRARKGLHWFGALLLLSGLIQLVPGLADLVGMLRVEMDGLRTTGQVVAVREMKDLKGLTSTYPIVEFTTANGATVQFQERLASSFPVGARVPVMYRAEAPAESATVRRPVMNWVHGAAFSVVGLLLAALGLRLLFV
jgi:hypothetical protein